MKVRCAACKVHPFSKGGAESYASFNIFSNNKQRAYNVLHGYYFCVAKKTRA